MYNVQANELAVNVWFDIQCINDEENAFNYGNLNEA